MTRIGLLTFFFLFSLSLSRCMTRKERFFSIFNIVSFQNTVCSSDDNLMGVCYTSLECQDRKGQPRGSCASGFGTCCVFISDGLNDLKVLDVKVGYIQNPNYPRGNTTPFRETVEIVPMNEKIRQIRLDMVDFEMDAGSEEEPCDSHKVRVILPDENVNIGDLCGKNGGQHLYIHLESDSRRYGHGQSLPVRIELEFSGARKRYQYNIRVEQLDHTEREDIERMAPRGCQQYFTDSEGDMRMFNIEHNENNNYAIASTVYQKNLKYSLCFKPAQDHCGILFTSKGMSVGNILKDSDCSPTNPFDEDSGRDDMKKFIGCGSDCFEQDNNQDERTQDYLLISGGKFTMSDRDDKQIEFEQLYCGNGLANSNLGVRVEVPGPPVLSFFTDDRLSNKDRELGWRLQYTWKSSCLDNNP